MKLGRKRILQNLIYFYWQCVLSVVWEDSPMRVWFFCSGCCRTCSFFDWRLIPCARLFLKDYSTNGEKSKVVYIWCSDIIFYRPLQGKILTNESGDVFCHRFSLLYDEHILYSIIAISTTCLKTNPFFCHRNHTYACSFSYNCAEEDTFHSVQYICDYYSDVRK